MCSQSSTEDATELLALNDGRRGVGLDLVGSVQHQILLKLVSPRAHGLVSAGSSNPLQTNVHK